MNWSRRTAASFGAVVRVPPVGLSLIPVERLDLDSGVRAGLVALRHSHAGGDRRICDRCRRSWRGRPAIRI